ncbi:MAG: DUF3810 domain-containing protein [Chitinophagaceae bacterium]|nr:MAG: DUF3810 domain-containing protein [Chitinophagaceae bacterium]
MKLIRKTVFLLILVCISVAIKLYSLQPMMVETGYSTQYFPAFGNILRQLFGWIPFSIGDVLYALLLCRALYVLYKLSKKLVSKQFFSASTLKRIAIRGLLCLTLLYIVFNLFWGINYNRKGIAWQLGLPTLQYDAAELVMMNQLLLQKVNGSKASLLHTNEAYPSPKHLFQKVDKAYGKLALQHPFLRYEYASLKRSMWGWLGNYAGFTGYYNPFTGEAQVNANVPRFLQPFTTCHEVAHQLGYAKEMEANFVGYLAASQSEDTLLHYSVYLDLFTYANRNLFMKDSTAAKKIRNMLSAPVKHDLKEWMEFNEKHKSFVEPIVRWGYGIFLRNNEQPQGMLSYDEVTGFLIAYYKKHKRI